MEKNVNSLMLSEKENLPILLLLPPKLPYKPGTMKMIPNSSTLPPLLTNTLLEVPLSLETDGKLNTPFPTLLLEPLSSLIKLLTIMLLLMSSKLNSLTLSTPMLTNNSFTPSMSN